MRSPALRVPRSDGEATRQKLVAAGRLRSDLRIVLEGEHLLLPILPPIAPEIPGDRIEAEFPEGPAGAAPTQYRELVELSEAERAFLPRSFDVIGDIVLIRVPDELASRSAAIGEALLRFVPNARIVGADHGVHGPDRVRRLERIAGAGSWSTRHRENGIEIDVDVERAYFSPRLAREHARVASSVRDGEEVFDLCCGVGPFALAIARDGRARTVWAVDHNPAAIELLVASAARLGRGDRLRPVRADVASFLAEGRPCDRAVLNLPHEGIKYLASVARSVRPAGAIHYYEVVDRTALATRGIGLVRNLEPDGGWRVAEQHAVHPYSSDSDLVAFELHREPARGPT